jgi:AcrR family transcriptional regulator
LFVDKGYTSTTTQDVADAAQVAASTLFRYFATKEELLLNDDFDLGARVLAGFRNQPRDLTTLRALAAAGAAVVASTAAEDQEVSRLRDAVLARTPELDGIRMREFERTVDLVAMAIAERHSRSPGDVDIRVLAGAVVGAFHAVGTTLPEGDQNVSRVISMLENGFTTEPGAAEPFHR